MNRKQKKEGKTVFRTVLQPLMLLTLLEAVIVLSVMMFSGVYSQLNKNERSILSQLVVNRANYLQSDMIDRWSDIGKLAQTINQETERLCEEGTLSIDLLESSSTEAYKLIKEVAEETIKTLYSVKATGVYIIFNTSDLMGEAIPKTGFHVRDFDPTVNTVNQYSDLLLECAPIELVKTMNISTDTGWSVRYGFGENTPYGDYLTRPYTAAKNAQNTVDAKDYGCWSSAAQSSLPSGLTYSIPLILSDGTVYGVVGIEMMDEYMGTILPYRELGNNLDGGYLLVRMDGEKRAEVQVASGKTRLRRGDVIKLEDSADGSSIFELNGEKWVAQKKRLTVYNLYAPFDGDKWFLLGAVPQKKLYAFSNTLQMMVGATLALLVFFGTIGSVMIAQLIANPIRRLSREVDGSVRSGRNVIPHLSETGIREVDHFAEAFAGLSRDAVNTSTRFLRMMDMASIDIGGCEFDSTKDQDITPIFATNNFFRLLGIDQIDPKKATLGQLRAIKAKLMGDISIVEKKEESTLICVRNSMGGKRYVRLQETHMDDRVIVMAEDVTASTVERIHIERERDYDLLTGLYNRRAFYRLAARMFDTPDKIGYAAVVMMDLDNLKRTNDSFGHEWGDRYIHEAATCFSHNIPETALCARVSGDEFTILFSGHKSREEAEKAIEQLVDGIQNSRFGLPNGVTTRIHVSGGIAWYPQDGEDLMELIKHADFAMYQVKNSTKDTFGTFERVQYEEKMREMHR